MVAKVTGSSHGKTRDDETASACSRAFVAVKGPCRSETFWRSMDSMLFAMFTGGLAVVLWLWSWKVPSFRIHEGHPISRWIISLNSSPLLKVQPSDVEVTSYTGHVWRGTLVAGSIQWPNSEWRAQFSVLPSLIRPHEAEAMKGVLKSALDEFDEDKDGVDEMITYEFIMMSAGAVKARDPPRESLRRKLLDITLPIIRSRIEPFVRKRYPNARVVCHSMIRRYLHKERRTHSTHWDVPSFVSVVVSLDSHGLAFDGGFFVTTGTGLQSFIPLQQGDTVVHQGDLLHGVHVLSGHRWSWAMWFQDTSDCSSDPAGWWKDEAEAGDPLAQTLTAMRARTGEDAWQWIQLAARSGFPRAMVYMGNAHRDGWSGRQQNLSQAAHWYHRARAGGDIDASHSLGVVERTWGNISGASFFFREGAERGDPNAMGELAAMFLNGVGDIPRNLDSAAYWFLQAADFKAEAMYQTYLLYTAETKSRPADQDIAALYLERAARMGYRPAMLKFVQPFFRERRWEEAVPWLLRLESEPFMQKFVELYQSGVQMKPFAVYMGEQVLQGFADQGLAGARRLLSQLQDASRLRREL